MPLLGATAAGVVLLAAQAAALNTAAYPPPFKTPPGNPTWTSHFMANAPQTDSSGDILRCRDNADFAWTFDDGPSTLSPQVVSALRSNNVKATFFVVGSQVMQNPNLLLAAYRAGHQIALHTWSHPYLTKLTDDQVVAEVVWTAKAVKEVIGVTPRFIRPPYGDINDRVRAVLKAMGLQVVIWNIDTDDWNKAPDVVDKLRSASRVLDGTIPLQHDLYDYEVRTSVGGINAVVPTSPSRKFRTVADCRGIAPYDETLLTNLDSVVVASTTTAAPSPTSESKSQQNAAIGIGASVLTAFGSVVAAVAAAMLL
nr:chitin deacetylase [Polyrhizophydium stewartii]